MNALRSNISLRCRFEACNPAINGMDVNIGRRRILLRSEERNRERKRKWEKGRGGQASTCTCLRYVSRAQSAVRVKEKVIHNLPLGVFQRVPSIPFAIHNHNIHSLFRIGATRNGWLLFPLTYSSNFAARSHLFPIISPLRAHEIRFLFMLYRKDCARCSRSARANQHINRTAVTAKGNPNKWSQATYA